MRRFRIPLVFALLLIIWLVFGPRIIELLTSSLPEAEGLPADYEFEGRLFYTQGFDGIWQVDMHTGDVSQWWQPPDGGLVTGIAASPDGSQLAIAYAPPSEAGFQIGTTDLYLSPSDQPDLNPILTRANENESYRYPIWSPFEQWVYYAHQIPAMNDDGEVARIDLVGERIAVGEGEAQTPEVILEGAEQLALSSDGQQIIYLQLDTQTYKQGLWVANHDGSAKREIVPAGTFRLMSSPRVAPNGKSVIVSASEPAESETARQDGGVQIASAHSGPWDIWQISLDHGTMTKITQRTLDGPWITWSPFGTHIAVLAAEGVFLVHEGRFHRLTEVLGEGEITWAR